MNPLREACLIAKNLDTKDLDLLYIFVDLLREVRDEAAGQPPRGKLEKLGAAKWAYQQARTEAGLPLMTSPATKRRTEAPKPPVDPAKSLAGHQNRKPPHPKPKPNIGSTPNTSLRARILETLSQSTGALSPVELAELLDSTANKVSASLCDAFLRQKLAGLKRMAGKNDGKPVYLYTYEPVKS